MRLPICSLANQALCVEPGDTPPQRTFPVDSGNLSHVIFSKQKEKPDNGLQTSCDDVCTLLPGQYLLKTGSTADHSTAVTLAE
jgi:hypothetical protein